MRPKFIYVAGPISKGSAIENLRGPLDAANAILKAGGIPLVPHLTLFWAWLNAPEGPYSAQGGDYSGWLDYDLAFLRHVADALYRLPGESKGADIEVAAMNNLGKPVFTTWGELYQWLAC